ncbi:MAG: methyltransferase domain-containing protein [Candidatus Sulfotelmatobacter sp.]
MKSLLHRSIAKFRLLSQGHLRCFRLALSLVEGKSGIEIGGPTDVFQSGRATLRSYGWRTPLPIYDRIGSLDNCNFSSQTMWSTHADAYHFSRLRPPGKNIIADGSDISTVADHTYDFVLSSHNLEHFANPVKALLEWKRITRQQGALILVLPDYRRSFDHRRAPTPVSHMLEDYTKKTGEDDATHLPEVLRLHDIARDGTLQTHTLEELRARSMNNLSNRILHHHVFDENNSVELLAAVGLEVLAVEPALPYHIFIVSRWRE